MPPLTSCPDALRWRCLLLGQLAAAEAEVLEQHLEQCASCQSAVRHLQECDFSLALGPVEPHSPSTVQPKFRPECTASDTTFNGDVALSKTRDELTDFLDPPQAPGELGRIGGCRIFEVLGYGGMGIIYRAEEPGRCGPVALKILRPRIALTIAARRRFMREAESAAAVKHDHIIPVHRVGEDRGLPFLVMPLLEGETLEDRLQREGPLSVPELLRIGREIAEGLAAAHAAGLTHRDIKPGNIWLEGIRRHVRILDFGLALANDEEERLTQTGSISGTPAYMAPEQAQDAEVDHRADLFSLGALLYRAATGEMPFRGSCHTDVLLAVVREQPPPPITLNPQLPTHLSDLIMQLLEKDPKRRPPSAKAAAAALAALEQPPPCEPAPLPPRPPRRPAIKPGRLFIALTAMAGLFLLGLLVAMRSPRGTVEIESEGDSGCLLFTREGYEFSVELSKTRKVRLPAGTWNVAVADRDSDMMLDRDFVIVQAGERSRLEVHRVPVARALPPPAPGAFPLLDQEWVDRVATLPVAQRLQAVTYELRRRNPEFKGRLVPQVDGDAIVKLTFPGDGVADLTPLQAMPRLRSLACPASELRKSLLTDLTPLRGLALEELDLSFHRNLTDLQPLVGMPLRRLYLRRTYVSDLTPLRRMPLLDLDVSQAAVLDLSPLAGMKLRRLHAGWTSGNMDDLSPLRGMPLEELDIAATFVSDLSPLRGMPLESVNVQWTRVRDLSPLRGMALKEIGIDFLPSREEFLASFPHLVMINGVPATQFREYIKTERIARQAWQREIDRWLAQVRLLPPAERLNAVTRKLRERNLHYTGVVREPEIEADEVVAITVDANHLVDISPIQAFPRLKRLTLAGPSSPIYDFSPLRGLPLEQLDLSWTRLTDLSFVAGMKLRSLRIDGTLVTDLSPLEGMPLEELNLAFAPVANLEPLRGCKLVSIKMSSTLVRSLAPLADMPLRLVWCGNTLVSDLSPLKGKPLVSVELYRLKVNDWSPLAGMPLEHVGMRHATINDLTVFRGAPFSEHLDVRETPVSDFSPLAQTRINELRADVDPTRDAEVLRSIPTLKLINGQPAAKVLQADGRRLSARQHWMNSVAELPADRQAQVVAAELRRVNPAFTGEIRHTIRDGVVREFVINGERLADLTPLRALHWLQSLTCNATGESWLTDISPLRGLMLRQLHLANHRWLSDLRPLADMALEELDVCFTAVSDLGPLRRMPLRSLDVYGTPVRDLSPLTYARLETLRFGGKDATTIDLSPLAGQPLRVLGALRRHDLAPLRTASLESIELAAARAEADALKEMPVRELRFQYSLSRCGEELLRELPGVQTVNGRPIAEVLKELEGVTAARTAWQQQFDDWLLRTRRLASAQRIAAVNAGLRQCNPDFDGELTDPAIEDDEVVGITLNHDRISDLSPLRAFPWLRRLTIRSRSLNDLAPLKGMPLTHLDADFCAITDLAPLVGMSLQTLHLRQSLVHDLAPLRGMPIVELDIAGTPVADLGPLAGMKLMRFDCSETAVRDLQPLSGQPLVHFNGNCTDIADLTPLRRAKLRTVSLRGTRVADLSPLADMPLVVLDASETPIADLRPLRGMKLEEVRLDNTAVHDLSPLAEMPLVRVDCRRTGVADIAPLAGPRLRWLALTDSPVQSLPPAATMPALEELDITGTAITPEALNDYKLKRLGCEFESLRDLANLRVLESLQSINTIPIAEFWKIVEARRRIPAIP